MCVPADVTPPIDRLAEHVETNGQLDEPIAEPVVDDATDATGPVCPPPTMTVLKRYMLDLPVKIDGEEFVKTARALAETIDEIADEEAAQAEQRASMKERLAALHNKQRTIAAAMRRGMETRPVDVERIALYEEGFVVERRADTLEELNRRPMRDEERQLPLTAEVAERAASAMVEHSAPAEAERP